MGVTIELKNLTTGYRSRRNDIIISSDITASLGQSELTCILGPNGAGKSTLLRTLCGFQVPLRGNVYIMGQPVESYSNSDLSRIVSVVLTDNSGVRNMTAWDVVSMGRSPYTGFWGRLSANDENIVIQSLRLVDIEWLKDRKMHTLSDGECQKVMIAKALAQQTPIIILDEPTAFLDYPSKIQTMLLLRRLAKSLQKTILLSTHDLDHALQISDKLWLLDPSLGFTTGTSSQLCSDGSISRYFDRQSIKFDSTEGRFRISFEQ